MRKLATDLSVEIEKALNEFSKKTREDVKKAARDTAKETVELLKATSPVDRDKYSKGWRVKEEMQLMKATFIVHNFRYANLTHLLEWGHATVNGGRTRAISHIAPAEKFAEQTFQQKIKEYIE